VLGRVGAGGCRGLHRVGVQRVVPVAMDGVSCDGQGGHGLVTDGQSGGIVAGVQFGVHAEPGAGGGGRDALGR
jgi:hypothetical protein